MSFRAATPVHRLGLACLVVGQAGCFAPSSPGLHASAPQPAGLVLPGTPRPRASWFDDRLDRQALVDAGRAPVRAEVATTQVRGGVRVGFDGRVRDTLRVQTRTESYTSTLR